MYLRLIILFLITLSPLILSGQHTEIEEDPLFQEKEDSNLLNNEIETDEIIHRVFISPIVIRPEIDSVQFHADISDIDVSEVEIEIENKCGNLIRLKALPDEKYQGNSVGHIYSTKKYDLFEGCSSEINPIGDRIFRSEYHANIINSAEAIADNQIIEHYEFDRGASIIMINQEVLGSVMDPQILSQDAIAGKNVFNYVVEPARDGDYTAVGLDASKRFYEFFEDNINYQIFYTEQLPFRRRIQAWAGASSVRNDVQGVGRVIGDSSDRFGSNGVMELYIGVYYPTGYSLFIINHEILHNYFHHHDLGGNFLNRPTTGFGQGYNVYGKIDSVDTDIYEVGQTVSYEDFGIYNDMELYIMGFIPIDEVEFPIKWLKKPKSVSGRNRYESEGFRVETQESFLQRLGGDRIPNHEDSPKEFRINNIILTDRPLNAVEIAFFDLQMDVTANKVDNDDLNNCCNLNYTYEEATGYRSKLLNGITRKDIPVMAPTLLANFDNTFTNQSFLELKWDSISTVNKYKLQISSDDVFSTIDFETETYSDQFTFSTDSLEQEKKFYWRVKSIYGWDESNWSETGSFTYMPVTAPQKIHLVSPINAKVLWDEEFSLIWHEESNSTEYQVQLSTNHNFNNHLNIENSDTSLSLAYSTLQEQLSIEHKTLIYWRVRGINFLGASDWSDIREFSFNFDTPQVILTDPADEATFVHEEIVFKWTSWLEDFQYRFQLMTKSEESVIDSVISDTTYKVTNLSELERTDYTWRVKPVFEGVDTEWSMKRSLFIRDTVDVLPGKIVLHLPQESVINPEEFERFSWYSDDLSESYRISITENASFNTVLVDSSGISDTTYTPNLIEPESTYHWKVQGINKFGGGAWSDHREFSLGATLPRKITLYKPQDNEQEVEQPTDIIWGADESADSYNLQVSLDEEFQELSVDSTSIADTTITAENLEQLMDYFWRVQAVNNDRAGDWSEIWRFSTFIATSVASDGIPIEYSVHQNYPNPFNPTTNIRFEIPESSDVRLEVYNILGQRVAQLVNERKSPGRYEVNFDASSLSSGVYLYRLQTDSYMETRQMMLIK